MLKSGLSANTGYPRYFQGAGLVSSEDWERIKHNRRKELQLSPELQPMLMPDTPLVPAQTEDRFARPASLIHPIPPIIVDVIVDEDPTVNPGLWWTTEAPGPKGPWHSREEAAQRGEPMGPFNSRREAREAR